jgi:hypothetical protein
MRQKRLVGLKAWTAQTVTVMRKRPLVKLLTLTTWPKLNHKHKKMNFYKIRIHLQPNMLGVSKTRTNT